MRWGRSCARSAYLSRGAGSELDEWADRMGSSEIAGGRGKEKWHSNQLEDKEQAYLRRVNRAIFKVNNGCLRAAKGEQASNSRRRNDQDDPGKITKRCLA